MDRVLPPCFILCALLLISQSLLAQLSLHVEEQFFPGKKILKVETTWDNYVWVLGEDNLIARISPNDEVEDFTAFFAGYSTKPFTDISARMADTLLLGTDGDYAFLFLDGQVIHYGAEAGLKESTITSVVIQKLYFIQYAYLEYPAVPPMSITTPNYLYGNGNSGGLVFSEWDPYENFSPPIVRFGQNDRKMHSYTQFYGESGLGGNCLGPEITNVNLFVQGAGALRDVPIDIHAFAPDSIEALYVSGRMKDLPLRDDFGFFWAGKSGLNYLFNTRNCYARSTPIPFFNGKQVQAINELHLLGALPYDFLSYMLIGTSEGLYVSDESQKQQFSSQYSTTVLGSRAIYDMESISYGVPIEVYGASIRRPFAFCEQFLFVATDDGVFKMNYSVAPASYAHVNNAIHFNGDEIAGTTVNICGSGDDQLTVAIFQDDNNFIQWQRNGEDIIGADTNIIYLTQPGVYQAIMWFGCENLEIRSKAITVALADEPVFTFDYPDTVALCNQSSYPLQVTGVQPGYRYQWYRNGEVIDGETATMFSATTGGAYTVGVSACGDNFVHADTVTLVFHHLERPRTTGENISVCEGRVRTLTLTGYAPETVKRWYRNGELIVGASDTALRVSEPGNYRVDISIGTCSVSSDELVVSFVAPPVALIQAASGEPICPGASNVLTAVHPADGTYAYRWSTGETTQSIEVSNAGVYTLILTNAGGCADTTEIEVSAYGPLAAPHIPDTVICVVEQQVVRLEAPSGYIAYYWNGGSSSGPYLDVTTPGTYSLQVEDENGCRVGTTVEVRPYCEELTVPNMFSPNGDGMNDMWEISGLEERSATVTVFDRNGQAVFQSRGYNTPWDGSYKGQLVPVGAYYYLIIAGGEQYRGPLTVLY